MLFIKTPIATSGRTKQFFSSVIIALLFHVSLIFGAAHASEEDSRAEQVLEEVLRNPEAQRAFAQFQRAILSHTGDTVLRNFVLGHQTMKPLMATAHDWVLKRNYERVLKKISERSIFLDPVRYRRLNKALISAVKRLGIGSDILNNVKLFLTHGDGAGVSTGPAGEIAINVSIEEMTKYSDEELTAVFAHELAHVVSKHSLIKSLAGLILQRITHSINGTKIVESSDPVETHLNALSPSDRNELYSEFLKRTLFVLGLSLRHSDAFKYYNDLQQIFEKAGNIDPPLHKFRNDVDSFVQAQSAISRVAEFSADQYARLIGYESHLSSYLLGHHFPLRLSSVITPDFRNSVTLKQVKDMMDREVQFPMLESCFGSGTHPDYHIRVALLQKRRDTVDLGRSPYGRLIMVAEGLFRRNQTSMSGDVLRKISDILSLELDSAPHFTPRLDLLIQFLIRRKSDVFSGNFNVTEKSNNETLEFLTQLNHMVSQLLSRKASQKSISKHLAERITKSLAVLKEYDTIQSEHDLKVLISKVNSLERKDKVPLGPVSASSDSENLAIQLWRRLNTPVQLPTCSGYVMAQ